MRQCHFGRVGPLFYTVAGLLLASCGGKWEGGDPPHTNVFPLECAHANAACDACHTDPGTIHATDSACISCHLEARPASHDPAATTECAECHVGSCGWNTASPHPAGFAEPELHGLEANLQGGTEGDCRDCHGSDLAGGAGASGCDTCHAASGHEDWRTDCTFCHGGDVEASGAPPQDLDGTSDPDSLTFGTHTAHVDEDGDYRALPCTECHAVLYLDALDPGHWFDDPMEVTFGVSEVDFTRGVAPATQWEANGSCSNNYCHGQGQRSDGAAVDNGAPMGCESCHATDSGWESMSGLHRAHLQNDPSITCTDCHAAIITREGQIDGAGRHVDGKPDVNFFEPNIGLTDSGATCTGPCHDVSHNRFGWGHPPDYDKPELHGLDANLQRSDCQSCHGNDLRGGIAQGCDDCHADEGHGDWRTDCTYCHGGSLDSSGAPPQDIDDEGNEDRISFGAHPEHTGAGTGTIGHPSYSCDQCHDVVTSVLTAGHAFDGTAGRGEVDLSAGWSYEGGFDPASSTCSNLYCHGNGAAPSGIITDGEGPLTCNDCHATTADLESMSGTHAAHLDEPGITCADCHAPVVDEKNQVVRPSSHVNRIVDLDDSAIGRNGEGLCTTTCHDVEHIDFGWAGPHPPGYDAGELHGPEALLRQLDCTSCHGADLEGGSGQGCDGCHADSGHTDWRGDCVFCHGGEGGDTEGSPPEDIDGTTREADISFDAHPEHAHTTITEATTCGTCHNGAQSYDDAFTDTDHWFDSTPTVAEVSFSGIAGGTNYASNTCSSNYCHGNGQQDGSATDGPHAMTCDGCHSYANDLGDLTGTHALHLGVSGVTCADCHGDVVDSTGEVTDAGAHVNEIVDVDSNSTVGYRASDDTCTNSCHAHSHTNTSWYGGHPSGYDDPEEHGQEALFQEQTCATAGCHGTDLGGGTSGQGCDSCHSSGWRSDCTFCHGDSSVSSSGLPPEDLDNTSSEGSITFKAHPEHSDGDTHPDWDCNTCHGAGVASYTDAVTDSGHWFDNTAGVAEVSFTGIAAGASYTSSTSTCSNLYCHGNGNSDGSETDSTTSLDCDDCHGDPPSTGEHRDHDHDDYSCAYCHAETTNTSDQIKDGDVHVDGTIDVDMNSSLHSVTWNGSTCNGRCHDNHTNERW